VNTDELEAALYWAERRVLEIQAKLHRWAIGDRERRFDDLFNLVTDPAFLLVAWDRVRGNKALLTFLWVLLHDRPGSGGQRPPRVRSAMAISASGLW